MKKRVGLLKKALGLAALTQLKMAKTLPKNSLELYKRIRKAGLQ